MSVAAAYNVGALQEAAAPRTQLVAMQPACISIGVIDIPAARCVASDICNAAHGSSWVAETVVKNKAQALFFFPNCGLQLSASREYKLCARRPASAATPSCRSCHRTQGALLYMAIVSALAGGTLLGPDAEFAIPDTTITTLNAACPSPMVAPSLALLSGPGGQRCSARFGRRRWYGRCPRFGQQ